MPNLYTGFLCCDVSSDGSLVAAGTELQDDDALILYWYGVLWLSVRDCTKITSIPRNLTGIPANQQLLSINILQPIPMTLQPCLFIPLCHRLSSSQVHQMVFSPSQMLKKSMKTKRRCTSARGVLASLKQAGTTQSLTHCHLVYGLPVTWKHSVSGQTRFALLFETDSSSFLIQPSLTSGYH